MEMETFDKVYYSSILIAVAIILFIVVINIIAYKIRKLRTDILQKNNKINVWYNNNLVEELYKKSQSLGKKKYDYDKLENYYQIIKKHSEKPDLIEHAIDILNGALNDQKVMGIIISIINAIVSALIAIVSPLYCNTMFYEYGEEAIELSQKVIENGLLMAFVIFVVIFVYRYYEKRTEVNYLVDILKRAKESVEQQSKNIEQSENLELNSMEIKSNLTKKKQKHKISFSISIR